MTEDVQTMPLAPVTRVGSAQLAATFELTKPKITLMSVMVAAGSMALATSVVAREWTWLEALGTLVAVALSVSGAGSLNMWWERELDARMSRTRNRPLPSKRLEPFVALALGFVLCGLSLPLMFHFGGTVATVLTAVAIVSYVAIYTPLKQRSSWALPIGAVPGAMPTLMGYTAVSGAIDDVSLVLFAILFWWQLPHFLAISIYREKEYAGAGYAIVPTALGLTWTRRLTILTAIPLVLVTFMLLPTSAAGPLYGFAAGLSGLLFMRLTVRKKTDEQLAAWARRVFFGTLIHQMVIFGALTVDVALWHWG